MADIFDIDNPSDFIEDINDFDYKKYIVNSDIVNKSVKDFYSGNIKKGYKIGISHFDEHFVCKENSLYALTGRKGMGKTTVSKWIFLMQSIVNDLIWVVAFQENSDWGVKVDLMQYLLGGYAKDIEREKPEFYKLASKWFDEHFIFLDIETIEQGVKTVEGLVKDGVNVHGVFFDPVNSFEFGYKDTGNTYQDGVYSSKKVLRWCLKNVSVYVSQHPNLTAARNKEREITPIDAEHGFWNNKAHFTWCINREQNSDENHLSVWNVREKLTGGNPTSADEPLIIDFYPTKIDIRKGDTKYPNVIQFLLRKHNPFNYEFKDVLPELKEIIPNCTVNEAFGNDEEILF